MTIEDIKTEYAALQSEQLAPMPKTNRNRHRYVEIVRQYQQKNGLLTPVSMLRPLKVKIAQPEKVRKPSKYEKKYSHTYRLSSFAEIGAILGPEEVTPETRDLYNQKQTIHIKPVPRTGCRVFFDMLGQAFIDAGKAKDIIEGRSKADKRLVYLFGRKFKMHQVIKAIALLKETPEYSTFTLYELLKVLKPQRKAKKQPETIAPTERTEAIKARSKKLCEFVIIESPQLIPNASLTAQNVIFTGAMRREAESRKVRA